MSKSKVDGETVESKEEHPFSINSLLVNDKGLFFESLLIVSYIIISVETSSNRSSESLRKKFYH